MFRPWSGPWPRLVAAGSTALLLALFSAAAVYAHDGPASPVSSAEDEQTVRSWTQTLRDGPGASRANATTVQASLLRGAEQRRAALERLARIIPQRALELTLTPAERNLWPGAIQALIEQPATVTGDVRVLHLDGIDHLRSETIVDIADASGHTQVILLAARAAGVGSGARVRASGVALAGGGPLLVSNITVLSAAQVTPTGLQRTAIILASVAGAPAHPYSNKANTASMFFSASNPQSARAYYEQNSYGQVVIVGGNSEGNDADVYGPYSTPVSSGECDSWLMMNQALHIATDLDYTRYDRVTISWNDPNAACWFGGVAFIGAVPITDLQGTTRLESVALDMNQSLGSTAFNGRVGTTALHEYGHNLGVFHAGAIQCGEVPLLDAACSYVEYGDPSDVMGGGSDGQFSPVHKEELGWLGGRLQYVGVGGSGFYPIYPYEDAAVNAKVLKIPRARDATGAVTGYYYIEYRHPQAPFNGFASRGSFGAGVVVHLAGQDGLCVPLSGCGPDFPAFGGGDDSMIVDTHPNSGPNWSELDDAPLTLGQWYTDPLAGMSIQVVDLTATGATVYVYLSAPQPAIQTMIYPPGAGRVIGGGAFVPGASTTLVATPNAGYQFSYWREMSANRSYPNPYSFTVSGDRLLEAVFNALPDPVPNDAFATALPIPAVPTRLTALVTQATLEPGEAGNCNSTPLSHTVWYSYSPASTGVVRLDTSLATYETVVAVYTGSTLATRVPIPAPYCDDGSGDVSFHGKLSFLAQAGVTYHVQVSGAYGGSGELLLDVATGGALSAATYYTSTPATWSTGQTQTYSVSIRNDGSSTWSPTGPSAVLLNVSFGGASDVPGQGVVSELYFAIPRDVPPNTWTQVTVTPRAPLQTGSFVVRHRLFQQSGGWFNGFYKQAVNVRVDCTVRPNVTLGVAPGGGRLTVSVAPGGGGSIRYIYIGIPTPPVNALIDAADRVGETGAFVLYAPPGSRGISFTIRRAQAGLATTVPFTVVDDCGNWPTFAGGGPTAF